MVDQDEKWVIKRRAAERMTWMFGSANIGRF
jgi:hypothetical protein